MGILRHIVLAACLLAAFAPAKAAGDARFAAARLEELAAAVHLPMPSGGDTCCVVGTFRGYPVVAARAGGKIVHVGLDLFGDAYKAASNALLCNFAERYLLELLAEEDEQARMRRMYDDGVAVMGDLGHIPLMSRQALRFAVRFIPGRGYRLEWHDGTDLRFSVSAPAQYELLCGMNKAELEDGFRNAVLAHPGPGTSQKALSGSEPVRLSEDLYVVRKGYYLLEQMECAGYYTRQGERFVAVCDTLHPVESLCNLLSADIAERDYTLDVTLRKYGFRSEEFSCPLGRLIDFCLESGCTPYVGVESADGGIITAALIMVNAEYGYNHLFKIVFDTRLLGQRQGHIAATVNVYTPTHNLENLFDEENQTRHRGASKIKL